MVCQIPSLDDLNNTHPFDDFHEPNVPLIKPRCVMKILTCIPRSVFYIQLLANHNCKPFVLGPSDSGHYDERDLASLTN